MLRPPTRRLALISLTAAGGLAATTIGLTGPAAATGPARWSMPPALCLRGNCDVG